MIDETEALARIVAQVVPLPGRSVLLSEAIDCFSAADCFAKVALPAFDNSAMDGYALSASDRGKGTQLRVTWEQPAGLDRQLTVRTGETIRVFTGAPLPRGTAAVIMQEDVAREGDAIVLQAEVEEGQFIRRRACDLAEGQVIVKGGQRIRTTTAALLVL